MLFSLPFLDVCYKGSYAVHRYLLGRSRYNDQISGGKAVKRQHSLAWRCINQDKVVVGFEWGEYGR